MHFFVEYALQDMFSLLKVFEVFVLQFVLQFVLNALLAFLELFAERWLD